MKSILLGVLAALMFASSAEAADHYVRGYYRSNGTYVAPHYQTNPNGTTSDNYSTRGNYNPYTGAPGTKPDTRPAFGSTYGAPTYGASPYAAPTYQPSYGSPTTHTSPYGASEDESGTCTSSYGC
jgi:opacity protein-like surface antigen